MEQSEEYIKGFNNGYKLAKFKPDLLAKLTGSVKGVNDYEKGLLAGIKEFEKEKELSRSDELSSLRKSKGPSKDRDLSR